MQRQSFFEICREAAGSWVEDRAPRMGAALAFFTIFAIAPLLVLVFSIGGAFFGRDAVEGHTFDQIRAFVGDDGAKTIQSMLASIQTSNDGTFAAVISTVMLLVVATGLFAELQDAMDTIWKAKHTAPPGVWGFIRDRLPSFLMLAGIALLLLISMVASTTVHVLENALGFGGYTLIVQGSNLALSMAIMTLLFAMIYRLLPHAEVAWNDVWLGAAITSLLFTLGKWLIGIYLARAHIASAYGSAGSFAVLLLWLYYSAQVFLFGAEFTYAHAIRNRPNATPASSGTAGLATTATLH